MTTTQTTKEKMEAALEAKLVPMQYASVASECNAFVIRAIPVDTWKAGRAGRHHRFSYHVRNANGTLKVISAAKFAVLVG